MYSRINCLVMLKENYQSKIYLIYLIMTINSNNYSNVQWTIAGQLIFFYMCSMLIRLQAIDLTTSVSALGNLHLRIS